MPPRPGSVALDEPFDAWLDRIADARIPASSSACSRRRPRRRRPRGRESRRLRGHGRPARPPARRRHRPRLPRPQPRRGAARMKVAIGADHAGVHLKAHLVKELERLGHDADRPRHRQHRVGRLPAHLRRRRPCGRRRRGRPRHRARGLRPGRADRGQQGPRRAGRPLQRSLHGPPEPGAQRCQRAVDGRPDRRRGPRHRDPRALARHPVRRRPPRAPRRPDRRHRSRGVEPHDRLAQQPRRRGPRRSSTGRSSARTPPSS